jgi:hypothetical protein
VSELFGQPYDRRDLHWVIKAYFDRMYNDGRFIEAVEYLVKGWGFSTDGAYCSFPDMNSYFEEDHFEGVRFSSGYILEEDVSIIVSDEVFCEYLKLACDKYLRLHSGDIEEVRKLLDRLC